MSSKDTLKNIEKLKKLGLIQAKPEPYVVYPTPIDSLNSLLPGGFIGGKQHLLYGSQQLGKTTLAIGIIAQAMKEDPNHITLLISAERGEDYAYYAKLGLDFESGRVMVMQLAQYMLEDTLEKLETYLCDEDGECLINSFVIDSWDALIGNKEMYTPDGKKKEATRETVGVKAAGASKMLKRIKGHIANNKVLGIVICQARTALGGYVAYEKFSGGKLVA